MEELHHWATLRQLEKTASFLGKRLVISFEDHKESISTKILNEVDVESINITNRVQVIFNGPFSIPKTIFMLLNHGSLTSLTLLESTHVKIVKEVSK